MATPRSQLIDPVNPMAYHLITKCVRGAFLCGVDKNTGIDYSYRKDWIVRRLEHLTQYFALDVYSYTIMSNHFHLAIYYDPKACLFWSAEEVAERWYGACPPKKRNGEIDEVAKGIKQIVLQQDPEALTKARHKLGSVSTFMKLLKQPIARRINEEDGVKGHCFEGRFYSGALLSERAMQACMAYVDLNPVRAKLAKQIEEIRHCSITDRMRTLENSPERINELIGDIEPLFCGLTSSDEDPERNKRKYRPEVSLKQYIARLKTVIESEVNPQPIHAQDRWIKDVSSLGKRQRAYGPENLLHNWLNQRKLSIREIPLP